MNTGMLMQEVDAMLEAAAQTLRLAWEIQAGIARAAVGELERLWRGYGSF